jgi:hypothetical protein
MNAVYSPRRSPPKTAEKAKPNKGESRSAGQGASEQTIRLRQRLPGHPGRYSLPRSVADRTDHRARHRRVYVPGSGDSLPAELQLVLGRNSPYILLAM